jgi:hypothetical protein
LHSIPGDHQMQARAIFEAAAALAKKKTKWSRGMIHGGMVPSFEPEETWSRY